MKRAFKASDNGKRFRYVGKTPDWKRRVGQLEYPLMDPGSALPGEGVLWFGPEGDRDGWDYVAPTDVEPPLRRVTRRRMVRKGHL